MDRRELIGAAATVPMIVSVSIGLAVVIIGLLILARRSPRGSRPKSTPGQWPVLWPAAHHYDQFRALCDDELPRTMEGYASTWGPTEDFMDRGGGTFVKVPFDPELMAQWCCSKFGKVDQAARAAYARHLVETGALDQDSLIGFPDVIRRAVRAAEEMGNAVETVGDWSKARVVHMRAPLTNAQRDALREQFPSLEYGQHAGGPHSPPYEWLMDVPARNAISFPVNVLSEQVATD